MFDFYKMGEADFWGANAMLSFDEFTVVWKSIMFAGLGVSEYRRYDYEDYAAGFNEAWAEHDLQIDRVEKPWRFEGFGCESREYIPA